MQDRSKTNLISPFTNKIEEKTKFSPCRGIEAKANHVSLNSCEIDEKGIPPKLGRIEGKTMWFSPSPNMIEAKRTKIFRRSKQRLT